ncbi:MAG: AI-2E family transporter [bacterium]
MEIKNINITNSTIFRIASFILGLWFLFQIRSIIVTLFVAFIFMTAIRPLVHRAAKIKIPSIVIVLALFIIFIGIASILVASLIPAVMIETKSLIQNLPNYMLVLESKWGLPINQDLISGQLTGIPSNILSIAAGAFGNILTVLAVFFMTYYLLIERPHLHKYLSRFFGKNDAEHKAEIFVQEVENRVGGWVRGELILMLIIGVMTYIGLLLLGIPYALPLAILAGLLEAVPNIGPTISAIPAILFGLTISPLTGLGALAMSILIQQLENNLIVPKVMEAATGVAPLATFIVLMIGFTLGGITGAVLAMPVYLVVSTAIKYSQAINI